MWGTQYPKLKTNLRLSVNRLKLLEKKKTELAMKARTEIVNFVSNGKPERARIRVEAIIRDDFLVEAYELLEAYCELLDTRFGIIQQMKEPDDGIAEAVISLLWVAPRIAHEVPEMKVISDQLTIKYGKPFAEAARMNQLTEPAKVNPVLIQKLNINAPSKILVERYLIEICRCANVPFNPDETVMREDEDEISLAQKNLNNFISDDVPPPAAGPVPAPPPSSDSIGWTLPEAPNGPINPNNRGGGGNSGGGGGGGGSTVPYDYVPPSQPAPTYNYPPAAPPSQQAPGYSYPPASLYPSQVPMAPPNVPSFAPPAPPESQYAEYVRPAHPNLGNLSGAPPPGGIRTSTVPPPESPIYELPPEKDSAGDGFGFDFPLPPTDNLPVYRPTGGNASPRDGTVDALDDLTRRFEELKKRT